MGQHRWLERLLEMGDESIPGQPILELYGDRRVLIENYSSVTEYGLQQVCIVVKYGRIQICGNGLQLRKMQGQTLVITGEIDSIQVKRGKC